MSRAGQAGAGGTVFRGVVLEPKGAGVDCVAGCWEVLSATARICAQNLERLDVVVRGDALKRVREKEIQCGRRNAPSVFFGFAPFMGLLQPLG